MKKTTVLTLLTVLLLFTHQAASQMVAAAPGSIQCPPPPVLVATFLGFTDGQAEQFGILLNQFQNDLRSLQEQIAPRQQQLNVLLSQPDPDPATVGALVLQLHALQHQMEQIIQSFQNTFAALLTQEQKQKIEAVTLASQLEPAVGAFVALHLVPSSPSLPCQKQ